MGELKFPTSFSCVGELWSYCATFWKTEAWFCEGQRGIKEHMRVYSETLHLQKFYLIEDWFVMLFEKCRNWTRTCKRVTYTEQSGWRDKTCCRNVWRKRNHPIWICYQKLQSSLIPESFTSHAQNQTKKKNKKATLLLFFVLFICLFECLSFALWSPLFMPEAWKKINFKELYREDADLG
jgi:hypothetical protein